MYIAGIISSVNCFREGILYLGASTIRKGRRSLIMKFAAFFVISEAFADLLSYFMFFLAYFVSSEAIGSNWLLIKYIDRSFRLRTDDLYWSLTSILYKL